jgi:hypothetical protein
MLLMAFLEQSQRENGGLDEESRRERPFPFRIDTTLLKSLKKRG